MAIPDLRNRNNGYSRTPINPIHNPDLYMVQLTSKFYDNFQLHIFATNYVSLHFSFAGLTHERGGTEDTTSLWLWGLYQKVGKNIARNQWYRYFFFKSLHF